MELIPLAYGIFNINEPIRTKVLSDQLPKGYYYKYSFVPLLLNQTSKIPLTNNIAFGVSFTIKDLPEDRSIVNVKILHPEIENSDLFTFTETTFPIEVSNDRIHIELYQFEEKWEMIPGFWSFQFWAQDILLYEQEFEVYTSGIEEDVEEKYFFDM